MSPRRIVAGIADLAGWDIYARGYAPGSFPADRLNVLDHAPRARPATLARARFAASCIDEFIEGNLPPGGWNELGGPGSAAGLFDGLDIDREHPGVAPGNGAHVSPSDRQNATLLLRALRRRVDPFEPALAPPAQKAFWNVAGMVAYHEPNGVPPSKMVPGVPFYGKEYENVPNANHGLFQSFSNPAALNDTPTYHDLVAAMTVGRR